MKPALSPLLSAFLVLGVGAFPVAVSTARDVPAAEGADADEDEADEEVVEDEGDENESDEEEADDSEDGGIQVAVTAAGTSLGSTVLVPEARAKGRLPIVVLLPFTGGTPQDLMDRFYTPSLREEAERQPFLIVLPDDRGDASDYSTGAAWDRTLRNYTGGIAKDVDEVVQNFDGDPARVVLVGYSMGGDLAWALMQRDPTRYRGAVIMGSRASYRAKGALEQMASLGRRLFLFMGHSERADRLAGSDAARAALDKARVSYKYARAPGEHVWAPPEKLIQGLRYVLK